jgi:hypothetical protein
MHEHCRSRANLLSTRPLNSADGLSTLGAEAAGPRATTLPSIRTAGFQVPLECNQRRYENCRNDSGNTTCFCVLGGKTHELSLRNMVKGPPGVAGPAYEVQPGYYGDQPTTTLHKLRAPVLQSGDIDSETSPQT